MPYTRDLDQVCILAAAWIETLFYGFYVCLFILAMYVMTRQGSNQYATTPSKIFFAAIILLFLIATFHEFLATYRLFRAYGLMLGPDGTPISYLDESHLWDNCAHSVMLGVTIWIGDVLVIYRCYLIWGRKFYIVIVPALLFIVTIAVNITLYVWYGYRFTDETKILPVVDLTYPLTFAQNLITTGLISWKVLKQYKRSKASGIGVTSRDSLLHVVRIIVESALLYTLELLILIVLYFTNSSLQYIVQSAIIPSLGIVFALIAIRVHIARDRSTLANPSSSTTPWAMSSADPVFHAGTTNGGVGLVSERDHVETHQILAPRKSENGVYANRETTEHEFESKKSGNVV